MIQDKGTQIPCLVVPPSVTFNVKDETTHKQIVTIYNPYDFPLQYKILTTNPGAYQLSKAKGELGTRTTTEIVVRLKPANCSEDREDKFLVEISDGNKTGGKKIVKSTILLGKTPRTRSPGGIRRSKSTDMNRGAAKQNAGEDQYGNSPLEYRESEVATRRTAKEEFSIYSLLPTIVGVIVLASCIPWSTRSVSEVYEIICAFGLGLLTMFIQMKMLY